MRMRREAPEVSVRGGPSQAESAWWPAAIFLLVPLHWLVTAGVLGLGWHHVVLGVILLGLALGGPTARRLMMTLFPFWLTGVLYEYSSLWAVSGGSVHVADLYHAEMRWFAVDVGHGPEVAAMALPRYANPVLDVVCGVAYLAYLFVPMIVALALFRRRPEQAERLSWSFLAVMAMGLIIYRLYPAAPPWYVVEHGMQEPVGPVAADPGGLVRVDALLGIPLFQGWYSHSSHIFAAVPSLHVAYPTALAAGTARLGRRWLTPTSLFTGLVAFAALYLGHHYVIDLAAGLACGLLADQVVRLVLMRLRRSELRPPLRVRPPREEEVGFPAGAARFMRLRPVRRLPGHWTNLRQGRS